jgi:hypothetical protein
MKVAGVISTVIDALKILRSLFLLDAPSKVTRQPSEPGWYAKVRDKQRLKVTRFKVNMTMNKNKRFN